jgi:hypothetical protein
VNSTNKTITIEYELSSVAFNNVKVIITKGGALGPVSHVGGSNNFATGAQSVVFGSGSKAIGSQSFIMGSNNKATNF